MHSLVGSHVNLRVGVLLKYTRQLSLILVVDNKRTGVSPTIGSNNKPSWRRLIVHRYNVNISLSVCASGCVTCARHTHYYLISYRRCLALRKCGVFSNKFKTIRKKNNASTKEVLLLHFNGIWCTSWENVDFKDIDLGFTYGFYYSLDGSQG